MRAEYLYLVDMVGASDAIARFLDGVTRERFLADDLLRSAVLHKLTIIPTHSPACSPLAAAQSFLTVRASSSASETQPWSGTRASSRTSSRTMQLFWDMDKTAMEAWNILFQRADQGSYIEALFNAVIAGARVD